VKSNVNCIMTNVMHKYLIYLSVLLGETFQGPSNFRMRRPNYVQKSIDCIYIYIYNCGPGSSVGIATGYGVNGPGIESPWELDFPHLCRPALGPT
jgi:hypothetical protein